MTAPQPYSFIDIDEPKTPVGRQRETTPFDNIIGSMTPDSGKAKRFLVERAAFDDVRTQLRSAGRLHGVNVRITPVDKPEGVEVTFSVRRPRPRKSAATE